MDNPIENEGGLEELEYEKFFGSDKGPEGNEGTSSPLKDQDTILSMIVLLLACLGLAALAHVFV